VRKIELKPLVNLPAGQTIDANTLYQAMGRSRQAVYYLRKTADFPDVFGRKSGTPHYDTAAVAEWLRAKNVKINWV